jgi:hypothetical protein
MRYHKEAIGFFGSELLLLKESIPKITDEKMSKAAVLLISCGQTGAAIIKLADEIDCFTSASVMLARAFMEQSINFCYVSLCDEKEYSSFILHPLYKHYHNIGLSKLEDDTESYKENMAAKKDKQERLKNTPIVQEALSIFSETNPRLSWTKKTLTQRIDVIKEHGKLLDVFFTINKLRYYSDASETLHGSLYGCLHNLGILMPNFDYTDKDELDKKLFKDNTCILLHLGMLIHECFTLISYSNDIEEIWNYSYKNRNMALGLLFHVLEKKQKDINK